MGGKFDWGEKAKHAMFKLSGGTLSTQKIFDAQNFEPGIWPRDFWGLWLAIYLAWRPRKESSFATNEWNEMKVEKVLD